MRVLPAHVVVAACAIGLATSDAFRLHDPAFVAAAGVLTSAMLAPTGWGRVALVAALTLVFAWWWGSIRLDALDRSRAGGSDRDRRSVRRRHDRRGSCRHVRPTPDGAHPRSRRVELELPLGRAPPQGARLSLLAVVKAPRGPERGFDERTWLRRQGVHVVLHVDEWHVVGQRSGLGGVADGLRRWLRRASSPGLTGERRALVEGVLLGDDGGLSDGTKQAFRRSGLYHLLAVSGQNVVLLAGGCWRLPSRSESAVSGVTWLRSPRSAPTCSRSGLSRR